jgi:hypothetical protein
MKKFVTILLFFTFLLVAYKTATTSPTIPPTTTALVGVRVGTDVLVGTNRAVDLLIGAIGVVWVHAASTQTSNKMRDKRSFCMVSSLHSISGKVIRIAIPPILKPRLLTRQWPQSIYSPIHVVPNMSENHILVRFHHSWAVLERFRQVGRLNLFGASQISDGAGQLEDTVVGTRRKL